MIRDDKLAELKRGWDVVLDHIGDDALDAVLEGKAAIIFSVHGASVELLTPPTPPELPTREELN